MMFHCQFPMICKEHSTLYVINQIKNWWFSELSRSPGFVLNPLLWGGLHTKSTDHGAVTSFIIFPCRFPSRFFIYSNHLNAVSEVRWSKPFPTTKDFRFQWSWALKLMKGWKAPSCGTTQSTKSKFLGLCRHWASP